MRALVIHGPNLDLLGTRELSVYGSDDLHAVNDQIAKGAAELGIEIDMHQTAAEGTFIDLLHDAIGSVDGAVVNPAAYAHTSRAIADAIRSVPFPVVEVHLSNIHAREPWRRRSVTAEAAHGIVSGFGAHSYVLGLHALKRIVSQSKTSRKEKDDLD